MAEQNLIKITAPFDCELSRSLKAGTLVLLSGTIYTARDKAHQKLVALLDKGEPLPILLRDQIIYYAGPTPAKPGRPIGSVGPTTSGRMDAFSPRLIREAGLRGMIGKGPRNDAVIKAMQEEGALYFTAIGGTGAQIARSVKKADVVAFPELGTEAVRRLEVFEFPLILAIDAQGANLFDEGPKAYRQK